MSYIDFGAEILYLLRNDANSGKLIKLMVWMIYKVTGTYFALSKLTHYSEIFKIYFALKPYIKDNDGSIAAVCGAS